MTRALARAALAALLFAPAARGQDAAAEAEKLRGDLQKALAAGTEAQKRLRLDGFEAAGDRVRVVGAYLDVPAATANDPVPFDQALDALQDDLRTRLKRPALRFDTKGVARIAPDKHPHVAAQLAANAAGAKEPAADRVRLTASRYDAAGALVLEGTRARDAATAKWLAGAVAALGPANGVALKGGKPVAVDAVEPTEWKLTGAGVQKALAASADRATRRVRADRAFFAFDVARDGDAARVSGPRFVVRGVRLGEEKLDVSALQDAVRALWPEALGGAAPVPVALDIGAGAAEPVARFRAATAAVPALDGVRIDPGAEFDATGALRLAGVQPGLSAEGAKALAATCAGVLEALAAKGDATAERYARLAAGPVSAAGLRLVPTPQVLTGVRAFAAEKLDDARVERLYFAADGGLRLRARTVTKEDGAALEAKFKELYPAALKGAPAAAGAPEPRAELSLFPASLTARLRRAVADDPKRWNGVLVARGYFDAAGRYALRGTVDAEGQNAALGKEVARLAAENPEALGAFVTDPPPAEPNLAVIPMGPLLERVRRVTPAHATFDGLRVEGARYDANADLVFDVRTVGRPNPEAAALLARLIREHKTYAARAPADRRVLLNARAAAPAGDDATGTFSAAYGAKLLAKEKPTADDRARARAWLDDALLQYPNESGVWYLSAYFHHTTGDAELARRDLFRVIELEGASAAAGSVLRKRRYEAAKDLQGTARTELEALWVEAARDLKAGAKPLALAPEK